MSNSNLTQKTFDFNWLMSVANNEATKDKIREILKWNGDVQEGKFNDSSKLFEMNLGNHIIWLRESEAWFAIHLYDHIFKEKEHLLASGFGGVGSEVVLDLGANIGMYTIAIKTNNPQCRVIAFEPNPQAFEVLQKNVESNMLNNVTVVNKGVSGAAGSFTMKTLKEGSAYGGKYLGEIKKEYRKWIDRNRFDEITVQSTTLADILNDYNLDKIDILKMDVEGMELEIIEGGVGVLSRIRRIVFEWHDLASKNKIVEILLENKFSMVLDDGREYGNLYFVNTAL